MNKAESSEVAACLEQAGYEATESLLDADLIFLNTCVVRQSAERKVTGTLGYLKGIGRKPGRTIVVSGCFVNSHVDDLYQRFPHVDLFYRPGAITELKSWLVQHSPAVRPEASTGRPSRHPEAIAAPSSRHPEPFASWPKDAGGVGQPATPTPPAAYVPIIQGCNNFCSYCIVPYRRGRETSRPLPEIVAQARALALGGVREITLVGQNVDSYGHDLPDKPDLANLLEALNPIDGLTRLRFLTNHPKDMSDRLIDAMAALDKVCEQINLPAQAGDNIILERMRRGYTIEYYRDLVARIRARVPGIALSTDLIVGFPGETDEQFQHTIDLVRDIRFDNVFVAMYSPRPGTTAARDYPDDVPQEVKTARRQQVEDLQTAIATEINASLEGTALEVLVEGRKGSKWFGRTRTNKLVFFATYQNCLRHLVTVAIIGSSPWSLQGSIASPDPDAK